jgi:hypothetical protein
MTDFENTFEWKMIKESDKTYFMNEHVQQDYYASTFSLFLDPALHLSFEPASL